MDAIAGGRKGNGKQKSWKCLEGVKANFNRSIQRKTAAGKRMIAEPTN